MAKHRIPQGAPNPSGPAPTHFGPAVIGEEEVEKRQEEVRKGRSVFGPSVVDYPEEERGGGGDSPKVLELSKGKFKKKIGGMTSVPRLEQLHSAEVNGQGRDSYLVLLEERINEILAGEQQQAAAGAQAGVEQDVWDLNVGPAKEFIATIQTIHALSAVRRREKANPNYPGGRAGVLDALDAREEELVGEDEEEESEE